MGSRGWRQREGLPGEGGEGEEGEGRWAQRMSGGEGTCSIRVREGSGGREGEGDEPSGGEGLGW